MKALVKFIVLSSLVALFSSSLAGEISPKGKAVLVTGASSGLGNKIALSLANNGVFVYAGARKQKDIDTLSEHKNMMGIRLDVTKQQDIEAATQLIRQHGKGLHGLVNNAGVFAYAPMIEVTESELDFQLDVNLYGPYRVTKAFAPMLIENKGRITTIGSVAGLNSGAMFGPYSITKFGVEAFTEALASEMKRFDVGVSVIEPGNFDSNIMKNMHKRLAKLKQENRTTLFEDRYKAMGGFTKADRSTHKDPQPVADAVFHALFSNKPQLRYLVVPNQGEARYAISSLLKKVAQANTGHAYAFSREQLIKMLDDQLVNSKPGQQVN